MQKNLKLSIQNRDCKSFNILQHIDFMFWEMCNPGQEFTRVDSIVLLLKLFFHHQDKISDGYFKVEGSTGSAVINPGKIDEK